MTKMDNKLRPARTQSLLRAGTGSLLVTHNLLGSTKVLVLSNNMLIKVRDVLEPAVTGTWQLHRYMHRRPNVEVCIYG